MARARRRSWRGFGAISPGRRGGNWTCGHHDAPALPKSSTRAIKIGNAVRPNEQCRQCLLPRSAPQLMQKKRPSLSQPCSRSRSTQSKPDRAGEFSDGGVSRWRGQVPRRGSGSIHRMENSALV